MADFEEVHRVHNDGNNDNAARGISEMQAFEKIVQYPSAHKIAEILDLNAAGRPWFIAGVSWGMGLTRSEDLSRRMETGDVQGTRLESLGILTDHLILRREFNGNHALMFFYHLSAPSAETYHVQGQPIDRLAEGLIEMQVLMATGLKQKAYSYIPVEERGFYEAMGAVRVNAQEIPQGFLEDRNSLLMRHDTGEKLVGAIGANNSFIPPAIIPLLKFMHEGIDLNLEGRVSFILDATADEIVIYPAVDGRQEFSIRFSSTNRKRHLKIVQDGQPLVLKDTRGTDNIQGQMLSTKFAQEISGDLSESDRQGFRQRAIDVQTIVTAFLMVLQYRHPGIDIIHAAILAGGSYLWNQQGERINFLIIANAGQGLREEYTVVSGNKELKVGLTVLVDKSEAPLVIDYASIPVPMSLSIASGNFIVIKSTSVAASPRPLDENFIANVLSGYFKNAVETYNQPGRLASLIPILFEVGTVLLQEPPLKEILQVYAEFLQTGKIPKKDALLRLIAILSASIEFSKIGEAPETRQGIAQATVGVLYQLSGRLVKRRWLAVLAETVGGIVIAFGLLKVIDLLIGGIAQGPIQPSLLLMKGIAAFIFMLAGAMHWQWGVVLTNKIIVERKFFVSVTAAIISTLSMMSAFIGIYWAAQAPWDWAVFFLTISVAASFGVHIALNNILKWLAALFKLKNVISILMVFILLSFPASAATISNHSPTNGIDSSIIIFGLIVMTGMFSTMFWLLYLTLTVGSYSGRAQTEQWFKHIVRQLDRNIKSGIYGATWLGISRIIFKSWATLVTKPYDESDSPLLPFFNKPDSFHRMGELLDQWWKAQGLDKKLGPFFAHASLWVEEFFKTRNLYDTLYESTERLSQAGTSLEYALSMWVKGVTMVLHLRYWGLHAERTGEDGGIVFADIDQLAHIVGVYVPLLIKLQDSKEWNQQIGRTGGDAPGELTATWGDVLQWGLALMMDPFLYDPLFLIKDDVEFNNLASQRLEELGIVSREKGGGYFLGEIILGPLFAQMPDRQAAYDLIMGAVRITPEQWQLKGLRPAYNAAIKRSGLKDSYFSILSHASTLPVPALFAIVLSQELLPREAHDVFFPDKSVDGLHVNVFQGEIYNPTDYAAAVERIVDDIRISPSSSPRELELVGYPARSKSGTPQGTVGVLYTLLGKFVKWRWLVQLLAVLVEVTLTVLGLYGLMVGTYFLGIIPAVLLILGWFLIPISYLGIWGILFLAHYYGGVVLSNGKIVKRNIKSARIAALIALIPVVPGTPFIALAVLATSAIKITLFLSAATILILFLHYIIILFFKTPTHSVINLPVITPVQKSWPSIKRIGPLAVAFYFVIEARGWLQAVAVQIFSNTAGLIVMAAGVVLLLNTYLTWRAKDTRVEVSDYRSYTRISGLRGIFNGVGIIFTVWIFVKLLGTSLGAEWLTWDILNFDGFLVFMAYGMVSYIIFSSLYLKDKVMFLGSLTLISRISVVLLLYALGTEELTVQYFLLFASFWLLGITLVKILSPKIIAEEIGKLGFHPTRLLWWGWRIDSLGNLVLVRQVPGVVRRAAALLGQVFIYPKDGKYRLRKFQAFILASIAVRMTVGLFVPSLDFYNTILFIQKSLWLSPYFNLTPMLPALAFVLLILVGFFVFSAVGAVLLKQSILSKLLLNRGPPAEVRNNPALNLIRTILLRTAITIIFLLAMTSFAWGEGFDPQIVNDLLGKLFSSPEGIVLGIWGLSSLIEYGINRHKRSILSYLKIASIRGNTATDEPKIIFSLIIWMYRGGIALVLGSLLLAQVGIKWDMFGFDVKLYLIYFVLTFMTSKGSLINCLSGSYILVASIFASIANFIFHNKLGIFSLGASSAVFIPILIVGYTYIVEFKKYIVADLNSNAQVLYEAIRQNDPRAEITPRAIHYNPFTGNFVIWHKEPYLLQFIGPFLPVPIIIFRLENWRPLMDRFRERQQSRKTEPRVKPRLIPVVKEQKSSIVNMALGRIKINGLTLGKIAGGVLWSTPALAGKNNLKNVTTDWDWIVPYVLTGAVGVVALVLIIGVVYHFRSRWVKGRLFHDIADNFMKNYAWLTFTIAIILTVGGLVLIIKGIIYAVTRYLHLIFISLIIPVLVGLGIILYRSNFFARNVLPKVLKVIKSHETWSIISKALAIVAIPTAVGNFFEISWKPILDAAFKFVSAWFVIHLLFIAMILFPSKMILSSDETSGTFYEQQINAWNRVKNWTSMSVIPAVVTVFLLYWLSSRVSAFYSSYLRLLVAWTIFIPPFFIYVVNKNVGELFENYVASYGESIIFKINTMFDRRELQGREPDAYMAIIPFYPGLVIQLTKPRLLKVLKVINRTNLFPVFVVPLVPDYRQGIVSRLVIRFISFMRKHFEDHKDFWIITIAATIVTAIIGLLGFGDFVPSSILGLMFLGGGIQELKKSSPYIQMHEITYSNRPPNETEKRELTALASQHEEEIISAIPMALKKDTYKGYRKKLTKILMARRHAQLAQLLNDPTLLILNAPYNLRRFLGYLRLGRDGLFVSAMYREVLYDGVIYKIIIIFDVNPSEKRLFKIITWGLGALSGQTYGQNFRSERLIFEVIPERRTPLGAVITGQRDDLPPFSGRLYLQKRGRSYLARLPGGVEVSGLSLKLGVHRGDVQVLGQVSPVDAEGIQRIRLVFHPDGGAQDFSEERTLIVDRYGRVSVAEKLKEDGAIQSKPELGAYVKEKTDKIPSKTYEELSNNGWLILYSGDDIIPIKGLPASLGGPGALVRVNYRRVLEKGRNLYLEVTPAESSELEPPHAQRVLLIEEGKIRIRKEIITDADRRLIQLLRVEAGVEYSLLSNSVRRAYSPEAVRARTRVFFDRGFAVNPAWISTRISPEMIIQRLSEGRGTVYDWEERMRAWKHQAVNHGDRGLLESIYQEEFLIEEYQYFERDTSLRTDPLIDRKYYSTLVDGIEAIGVYLAGSTNKDLVSYSDILSGHPLRLGIPALKRALAFLSRNGFRFQYVPAAGSDPAGIVVLDVPFQFLAWTQPDLKEIFIRALSGLKRIIPLALALVLAVPAFARAASTNTSEGYFAWGVWAIEILVTAVGIVGIIVVWHYRDRLDRIDMAKVVNGVKEFIAAIPLFVVIYDFFVHRQILYRVILYGIRFIRAFNPLIWILVSLGGFIAITKALQSKYEQKVKDSKKTRNKHVKSIIGFLIPSGALLAAMTLPNVAHAKTVFSLIYTASLNANPTVVALHRFDWKIFFGIFPYVAVLILAYLVLSMILEGFAEKPLHQATVTHKIIFDGVGLYTQIPVEMEIMPAPVNTSIVFERSGKRIPVDIEYQFNGDHRTKLVNDNEGATVFTVEHILSALAAVGITNAVIRMDSDEPPIFNGSAKKFVETLTQKGVIEIQNALRRVYTITQPVAYLKNGEGVKVIGLPGEAGKLRITYIINSAHPAIGAQHFSVVLNRSTYWKEIAWARSYGFYSDLSDEQKIALGDRIFEEAILLDRPGYPQGFTMPDEAVRHKILDLLGDLMLFGSAISGHIIAIEAGHNDHHEFIRELRSIQNGESRVLTDTQKREIVAKLRILEETGRTPPSLLQTVSLAAPDLVHAAGYYRYDNEGLLNWSRFTRGFLIMAANSIAGAILIFYEFTPKGISKRIQKIKNISRDMKFILGWIVFIGGSAGLLYWFVTHGGSSGTIDLSLMLGMNLATKLLPRPIVLDSNPSSPAKRLLETLGIDEQVLSQAQDIENQDALLIKRIHFPKINLGIDPGLSGPNILSVILRKDFYGIFTFDLLFNDQGQPIAIFPVPQAGQMVHYRKSPYIDLSPYYFDLKDLLNNAGSAGPIRLGLADNQAAIQAYIASSGIVFNPMVRKPFVNARLENGRLNFTAHNLGENVFFDAEAWKAGRQFIGFIFPSVYSPADNQFRDREYYSDLLERKFENGQNILIGGPGVGMEIWRVAMQAQEQNVEVNIYVSGINALEIQNTLFNAGLINIRIREFKVADNIIDQRGRPHFLGVLFDWVFWNMPEYDGKSIEEVGFTLNWDSDDGITLQMFIEGLKIILKSGGQAMIWNSSDSQRMPIVERYIRSHAEPDLQVDARGSVYFILNQKGLSAQPLAMAGGGRVFKWLESQGLDWILAELFKPYQEELRRAKDRRRYGDDVALTNFIEAHQYVHSPGLGSRKPTPADLDILEQKAREWDAIYDETSTPQFIKGIRNFIVNISGALGNFLFSLGGWRGIFIVPTIILIVMWLLIDAGVEYILGRIEYFNAAMQAGRAHAMYNQSVSLAYHRNIDHPHGDFYAMASAEIVSLPPMEISSEEIILPFRVDYHRQFDLEVARQYREAIVSRLGILALAPPYTYRGVINIGERREHYLAYGHWDEVRDGQKVIHNRAVGLKMQIGDGARMFIIIFYSSYGSIENIVLGPAFSGNDAHKRDFRSQWGAWAAAVKEPFQLQALMTGAILDENKQGDLVRIKENNVGIFDQEELPRQIAQQADLQQAFEALLRLLVQLQDEADFANYISRMIFSLSLERNPIQGFYMSLGVFLLIRTSTEHFTEEQLMANLTQAVGLSNIEKSVVVRVFSTWRNQQIHLHQAAEILFGTSDAPVSTEGLSVEAIKDTLLLAEQVKSSTLKDALISGFVQWAQVQAERGKDIHDIEGIAYQLDEGTQGGFLVYYLDLISRQPALAEAGVASNGSIQPLQDRQVTAEDHFYDEAGRALDLFLRQASIVYLEQLVELNDVTHWIQEDSEHTLLNYRDLIAQLRNLRQRMGVLRNISTRRQKPFTPDIAVERMKKISKNLDGYAKTLSLLNQKRSRQARPLSKNNVFVRNAIVMNGAFAQATFIRLKFLRAYYGVGISETTPHYLDEFDSEVFDRSSVAEAINQLKTAIRKLYGIYADKPVMSMPARSWGKIHALLGVEAEVLDEGIYGPNETLARVRGVMEIVSWLMAYEYTGTWIDVDRNTDKPDVQEIHQEIALSGSVLLARLGFDEGRKEYFAFLFSGEEVPVAVAQSVDSMHSDILDLFKSLYLPWMESVIGEIKRLQEDNGLTGEYLQWLENIDRALGITNETLNFNSLPSLIKRF